MANLPPALSKGEELFAVHCKAYRLNPVREHRFHPVRQFRFDFAWPEQKLAVEIEGLSKSFGRHQRPQGFATDCEKYNLGALNGWRILRYTTAMVERGTAIDEVLEALSLQNSQ